MMKERERREIWGGGEVRDTTMLGGGGFIEKNCCFEGSQAVPASPGRGEACMRDLFNFLFLKKLERLLPALLMTSRDGPHRKHRSHDAVQLLPNRHICLWRSYLVSAVADAYFEVVA
jgi:hypothetical protein